ncbi:hypothetical protein R1flu_022087 [Riccia fluitans]|uniref:Kinesin motor domain-containing protein n=1 Tax=Riccia fluitans TaxID=41844 RepID=A0ABD1ZUA9_9MARC
MEQEKKEKVYVLVRVRPLSKEEATARSPWKLSSKSIALNKNCRPSAPSHTYTFDRIYGTKTPTLDIYNAHVKDIVTTTMSGSNGTVIAYGQCGSGKTYTLLGLAEEAGILTLAVKDMFQIVQEASNKEFLIRISYLEIAEDELNDLLASKNHKLDIREDAELGVAVAGLREEIVNKAEQVISLLEFAEARRTTNPRFSHTVIRLVIESRNLDKKEDMFDTHGKEGYQISVLNLVEVAPAKVICGMNGNPSQEAVQADRCLLASESIMSKLVDGGASGGDCVPYCESKLTHILRPSLGGNSRTCFICNISPAMVHMGQTIETLAFALKTAKVINRFKVNEVYTNKALLKRQKREVENLRKKLKELPSPDLEEEILSRRNALLMIEVEKEQMSLELSGKTPSSSQGESKEHDQDQRGENLTFGGESGLDKYFDTSSVDFNGSLQKGYSRDYFGSFSALERLQELDSQMNSPGLCFSLSAGTKRKRSSSTTAVAYKVDLPFQSKVARDLNWKPEGPAGSQGRSEMQTSIAGENKERQELHAQVDEHWKSLQQKISELEAEKTVLENRLHEREVAHCKEVEALRYELSLEKSTRVKAETSLEVEVNTFRASDGLETRQDSSQGKLLDSQETALNQSKETQASTLQENENQHKVAKGKECQTTCMTKKNWKVYQKAQSCQGRSELSSLRKELAVAKETITALEDERNGLWKDLNQMKLKCKEIQDIRETENAEEVMKDEHKCHQLEAAVDTLKAEVESTASITDDLLAILLESFQIVAADLKSFQESVAEIKVLNGTTTELSETIEQSKIQLSSLRHGKLTSDKELNEMKSELAKLECVVERQSGVLKVLSDNENLLNELASVRTAMKEAAGASELQISSIQQEYETKLKELESDCKQSRQEFSELEEEQTKLQQKLSTAEAEVTRLTQSLDEKSKPDKKRPPKYVKARLAEAEAEIVRLNGQMKEKSLSEDGRKIQEELAVCRAEVEKLRKEVEAKSQLDKEHGQILSKLAESEAVVVKLTGASEEQKQVEMEQKDIQLKLESEIAKMAKLLEEKSGVEEQLKKIQSDFASLQEKIENLTEEAHQKDVLEKKHCEVLLRLDSSEKEVAKLSELLKGSKEQSELYLGEMLERSRNSEAEMVTMSQSLQREIEERQRLEEEHCKHLEVIATLESENSGLAGSLKQVLKEKEEERQKDLEIISSLKAEVKELTQSLSSLTEEMEKAIEYEKRTRIDAVKKLEAELKELADGLSQEEAQRNKLGKELKESRDKNLNLDVDLKNLTEILQRSIHEKDEVEKVHKKDFEVIAGLEIKIRSMTESLQQSLEEKKSLEEQLIKALEGVSATTALASKLTEEIESVKEGRRILEDELRKGLDDHSNLESRVARLVEQLDEELGEKSKLDRKAEIAASKLAIAQEEVANMTMSLTRVTEEKTLLEKSNVELLETCNVLKLEMAKLSENTLEEIEFSEGLERKTSETFKGRTRAAKTEAQKKKERKILEQDTAVNNAVTLQDEAGTLARELDTRKKLVNNQAQVLDQLNICTTEAANISRHSIDSLSDVLEEKSRLEKDLQNLQLHLAGSEAEIIRLKEELTVKSSLEAELSRTQHKLAKVTEEICRLRDEKRRLEEEQRKLPGRSAATAAEVPTSSGDFRHNTTLTEDVQLVRAELNESKAELAVVRTALREKLCLEETLIKTQIELVEKQGECEKLTKELRVNRKTVKEQKKLLLKLSSTQSEVSKLKTAMIGRWEDLSVKTQNVEMAELHGKRTPHNETDEELVKLREKFASAESEVKRLTGLTQEKEKLEEDHARVQFELGQAETEVRRLTGLKQEMEKLEEDHARVQFELGMAEKEVRRLTGLIREKEKFEEVLARVQFELVEAETEVQRLATNLAEASRLNKEKESRWKEQEEKLQNKVAALEKKVICIEEKRNSQKYQRCAECEVLQTIVEQLRKERDELKERYTGVQTRIKTLQAELENRKKEFESLERNWKTKSQKNEKELADFRLKISKLEEGIARIVQEKKVLEERLSSSESQVAALRESARTTSKDLEMAHHKLHLIQSQHQSHVAAICGELSMKNARTVELEKELKTLLSQPPPPLPPHPPPPPPPAPVMQNEFASYVTSPYRPQQWSFPPLQPPQQPNTHHHEQHWGGVQYKGQQR